MKGKGTFRETFINIYTDGSCLMHDKRKGGVGMCFVTTDEGGEERIDDKYGESCWLGATNQQMELKAVTRALEQPDSIYSDYSCFEGIVVFTDSMYVKDYFNTARFRWSKQKWRRSTGAPVENAELWKELVRAVERAPLKVEFEWVKAHKSNQYNNIADALAKEAAKNAVKPPLYESSLAPKRTKEKTKSGSVAIDGRVLNIRIIERKSLPASKTYRYRYEVIEEGDKDLGCADFLFFDDYLSRHSELRVRLNENPGYPQIEEIIEQFFAPRF